MNLGAGADPRLAEPLHSFAKEGAIMKRPKAHSPSVPVYRDAGFLLSDIQTTKNAFKEETGHPRSPDTYIYSRYRNPTVTAAEERLMALEDCAWALLTQSGMSAIDLALSLFQKGVDNGIWLFFRDIYGGTNSFIDCILTARRGIGVARFQAEDNCYNLEKLEHLLDEVKPRLLYFEAVSNPMLIVADGEAIIRMAKSRGITVVVDNTFATPMLWRPLEQGADIVVHSATKYLGGHNNITAGVVCGNDSCLEKEAIEYRKWMGHMLSPDDAYRLNTQLKTFELRFSRHCENAARLASALSEHKNVEQVLYPGLETHPTHREAAALFQGNGFGAMITFDIRGDGLDAKRAACDRFIATLSDDIPLIPTLGDVETILLPVEAVWGEKYPYPGMIRLSVGIETYASLESTILKGREAAAAG
jgi:cystathionine beta-lyase/cystathionine gamma-synthase